MRPEWLEGSRQDTPALRFEWAPVLRDSSLWMPCLGMNRCCAPTAEFPSSARISARLKLS